MTEAAAFRDGEVFVVGGGNSAGQAAMYLSKFAKNVYILVRKETVPRTMSAYLIDQIGTRANIHVMGKSEITCATGDGRLKELTIANAETGETETKKADALYIFIGARPYTEWIGLDIIKDDKGFVETGRDLKTYEGFNKIWKQGRDPYLLETSCTGMFAAGGVFGGWGQRWCYRARRWGVFVHFVGYFLCVHSQDSIKQIDF